MATLDESATLLRVNDLASTSHEEIDDETPSSAPLVPTIKISREHLFIKCFSLVIITTMLVVMFPVYLESVNISGDTYSAILFISLVTCLPWPVYLQLRYNYFRCLSSQPSFSPWCVLATGGLHGLALIMISMAVDRKRVVCHVQEPMMALVVMFLILVQFFRRGNELSPRKMFSLCGVFAGLFLAMDFQLNDPFRCRGVTRTDPRQDGGDWDIQTHVLWTIVYSVGLFAYMRAWLRLETAVMLNKESTDRISIVLDSASLLSFQQNSVSSKRWHSHLGWFLLGSLGAAIALIWIDFFPAFGKATSPSEFLNMTTSGLACHFIWHRNTCGVTAPCGWSVALCCMAFYELLGQVLKSTRSMTYCLCVASVSLPLTMVWWSMFSIGGLCGMSWNPQVTGELIFSLLGLPVMIACLMYWNRLEIRGRKFRDNLHLETC